MRKISLATALVLATSLLLPAHVSAATPVSGAACAKAGLTSSTPTKKFTCVKSGKKFVWDKGSTIVKPGAVPAPAPKQSAAPSPTKAPFKALIPIPLPVPQTGAITFENAVANFSKIPEQAYLNVQAAIAAGSEDPVNVAISVGPTTNTTQDVILNGIKRELKLFNGFTTPIKLQAIAYNAADTTWATSEWLRVAGTFPFTNDPKNYVSRIAESCEIQGGKPVNCGGGYTFMVPGSDAKFIFYGVENGNFWTANPPDYQTATQVNHEFTHALQDAQFEGVTIHPGDNVITDTVHRAYPCWFNEGQANALGISIYIPTLASYLQVRDRTVTARLNPGQQNPLPDYSATAMTNFLMNQEEFMGPNSPGCYRPGTGMYTLGYSVGMAATEALIAIGGPRATVALIAKAAEGLTFAQSFQAVYGVSWSDGATVLGKVLAAEYAAKPLN